MIINASTHNPFAAGREMYWAARDAERNATHPIPTPDRRATNPKGQ